jgi:hypothetical protein
MGGRVADVGNQERKREVKGKKKYFGELGSFKGIASQSDKQALA